MLIQIISYLISTVGGFLGAALLLRAYMQWARAGGPNPLSEFVWAMTNWIVRPLRRVIPGVGGIDWASIVAAFLIALGSILLLQLTVAMAVPNSGWINPLVSLLLALVWVVRWALYMVMLLVIVYALIGWVNPHAPIAPTLNALVNPLLRPFRKVIPNAGGIDLSPLALLVLVQIGLLILNGIAPG